MSITSKSDKLGVLMIGFSPVVRAGLQAIQTKDKRLEVIGDAPDGYDALLYIKRLHDRGQAVNVILTETRNNGVDGAQATRIIKDEFPEIAILVLTDNLNDSYVIDAIHAGAGGYISETKLGNPIDEAKFGTGAIVSIVKSKQSTFWLAVIE